MAAAEGQRLALQQMVADARDKGAAAAARPPPESAGPPESAPRTVHATEQAGLSKQPASSQPASSLDPSAAASPRSSSAAATASLFSEGQLEAWSTGSLPRGDNQVTRVASALGHVADADPKV
jgi:hypothetical protein